MHSKQCSMFSALIWVFIFLGNDLISSRPPCCLFAQSFQLYLYLPPPPASKSFPWGLMRFSSFYSRCPNRFNFFFTGLVCLLCMWDGCGLGKLLCFMGDLGKIIMFHVGHGWHKHKVFADWLKVALMFMLKVGTHEATSLLKSLYEGTGRRDLSHEQFTQSVLRNKSEGLVPKFQTGLNLWD